MEDLRKLDEIEEKADGAESFKELKSRLTESELAYYMIYRGNLAREILEGEERIIEDILKLLGAEKRSVKHSLYLLDVAKETLLSIARFEF